MPSRNCAACTRSPATGHSASRPPRDLTWPPPGRASRQTATARMGWESATPSASAPWRRRGFPDDASDGLRRDFLATAPRTTCTEPPGSARFTAQKTYASSSCFTDTRLSAPIGERCLLDRSVTVMLMQADAGQLRAIEDGRAAGVPWHHFTEAPRRPGRARTDHRAGGALRPSGPCRAAQSVLQHYRGRPPAGPAHSPPSSPSRNGQRFPSRSRVPSLGTQRGAGVDEHPRLYRPLNQLRVFRHLGNRIASVPRRRRSGPQ